MRVEEELSGISVFIWSWCCLFGVVWGRVCEEVIVDWLCGLEKLIG